MKKRILVIGGTGAMGVYLVPELLRMGYAVDVASLDTVESQNPDLRYIVADLYDDNALRELLKNEYAAIVDFMVYWDPEKTFLPRRDLFLQYTEHYIFLSTYRIYAGIDAVTTENSPRLYDVSKDADFMAVKKHEYSLYKAMSEDMMRASAYKNWSIVRPAITYSKRRFQLTTLEAQSFLPRTKAGKTVLLPKQALDVQATMSWAGDVAVMIARLLFNKNAFGETYSVTTAEHNSWREIAELYGELCGLKYAEIDKEDYLAIVSPDADYLPFSRYQLEYDRMFDRVMDNSKILNITGMKQSELMPLREGLRRELAGLPENLDGVWQKSITDDRMDAYIALHTLS